MSLPGRRYTYRPYSTMDDPTQYNSYGDVYGTAFNGVPPGTAFNGVPPGTPYTGPPPDARNVRTFTLPHRRGVKGQEPIWIVPPKKEPRFITMEVKEPDPEPILIVPPPPPKQKIIEYEVPVKQREPEPIMVPMLPPPQPPEYVTVRQVVEEPQSNFPPPVRTGPTGPTINRLPDDNGKRYREDREDTLLGVPRTFLWELVLASFVLFIIMLLIAVFIAGFLS